MTPYFIFIATILSATNLHADKVHTIAVPDGDTKALIAAVDEANEAAPDDMTIIRVSGLYEFAEEDSFSPITGNIVISGQPGRPTVFDAGSKSSQGSLFARGPDRLFRIEREGQLGLSNLDISNFRLSGHYSHEQSALFENDGNLNLRSIQFRHDVGGVAHPSITGETAHPLVRNTGELTMESVALVDVGMHSFGVASGVILHNESRARLTSVLVTFEADYLFAVINNEGWMEVINSTFIEGPATAYPRSYPIWTRFDGVTRIGNSVIEGYDGAWCSDAHSLGHNVHAKPGCNFREEGDIVNIELPLFRIETVSVSWQGPDSEHLIATPKPQSILVDSADAALCPNSDLIGRSRYTDGDGDGVATCDRGAVELSGAVLKTGGITGYYFDRDSDGHYLYVLDNPHNILVTWNTFDRFGRQAWIYATGELNDDNFLEADAYINLNGRLTDFGPVDIERAKLWGEIRVEFSSCRKGHFWFESPDPDFGSGEFDFDRLAYSEQLRCIDP